MATKTEIPRTRRELLARPRLAGDLDQATARELVLVSTPAGFGKTTLLAEWARNAGKPVAWLSLDRDDNDPTRFWRYIAAAFQRMREGIAEQALALLNAPAQATLKAIVTALANDLATQPGDLVLILDDYHLIESLLVHDSLAYLLEHLPPRTHVVIASRSDPPIPLARFRARGQLVELRAADLRFTLEEATALLRDIWGLSLPEESIVAVEARTEGWATGLQLAALSLQGAGDPVKLVEGLTGSQRYILDYLTQEVLERLPGDIKSLLLETSVVEQLCGPLCDALTGRSDGQEMLEYLERSNLFLEPLDQERRWYRYHNLFAELLLARLQSADPRRVLELRRKAASWFEAHGLIGNAVRCALAAYEAVWAARLVEQNVEELLRRGEGETLREWLAILPREAVRARPRLALAQALAAYSAGDFQAAERYLDEVEQAGGKAASEPYEPAGGKEMSMLANVPATTILLRAGLASLRGDAERAIEFVRSAQATLRPGEPGPRVSIRWNLAQAEWIRGHLVEAERLFSDIGAEGRRVGEAHLVLTASSFLGGIQRAQGRLDAALRTYQESLGFATRAARNMPLSAAVAHVGIAEVLYERNQLEPALRHAGQGVSLGRQLTTTQPLANGLAALAWIRQAMGDPHGAREAMTEAYQVTQNPDIVPLYNPVPAGRARLLLIQGDLQEAAHWVNGRRLVEENQPAYAREPEYLVLVRILLARNAPDRALELLQRLEAIAQAQSRTASVIEVEVLEALAFQVAGQGDRAMKVLAQVLLQAEPAGYIRTFVDEGTPMAALLHHALSRGITPDYTSRLLSAFPFADQARPSSPHKAASALTEPLSERELEVLRLLASGASNQEIAEELSIALTTARKHVSNIIGKLGASNRTQAVSRGRDLGLL